MVMRRRRFRKTTIGKDAIKHSTTLLANIGQGTAAPTALSIYDTDAGTRSTTGSNLVVRDDADIRGTVNVGNIVKYINVCIQVGPRWITGDVATKDDNGWLEWALVLQTEQKQAMLATNLGVQTLGDIANKQYRRNCLYTGCIPIGAQQPNALDMKFKIPPKWQKLQIGANLQLFVHYRSVNSTDVRTDSHRVLLSSIYKCYV